MTDRPTSINIDCWPGIVLGVLRNDLQHSPETVADALGKTTSEISSYENGESIMSPTAIKLAAEFFGVSPAAFFVNAELKDDELENLLNEFFSASLFQELHDGLNADQRSRLLDIAASAFDTTATGE